MKVELFATPSYWTASEAAKQEVLNGCGPGGWKGALVPDSIYFVSIKEACYIHDWMYHEGTGIDDKERADRVFLNNMVRLIDARNSWGWLQRLRLNAARKYYQAVKWAGGPSFWANKNDPEEMGAVEV